MLKMLINKLYVFIGEITAGENPSCVKRTMQGYSFMIIVFICHVNYMGA